MQAEEQKQVQQAVAAQGAASAASGAGEKDVRGLAGSAAPQPFMWVMCAHGPADAVHASAHAVHSTTHYNLCLGNDPAGPSP